MPATFVKDHANREHPVLMSYRRPHLALSARDELVGVFWSPPFEGPLLAPAADVPRYYEAYPNPNPIPNPNPNHSLNPNPSPNPHQVLRGVPPPPSAHRGRRRHRAQASAAAR